MKQTKFKQTEIGEIPDEWELRELGSLGQVITGKTPPTRDTDNFGSGYPFITPRDMVGQKYVRTTERYITEKGKDTVKNCLLPADSVCVSCIGSDMGKVVMTDRPSITNQQLNSLVCEQVEPHFVYYGIINITNKLRDAAFHSTAVPILNKSTFSRFEIPIPRKKSEQCAIAKIISDLDEKIELNNQMNKTLEAIAQAIFKRWFVEFEFPDALSRPYKSSRSKMIDSPLGKIPEGWRISKIGDLAQVLSGFAFKSSDFAGDGRYRLVTIKNVQDGYFEGATKDGLDTFPDKMPEYCKLQNGDILLSLTGNVGRICLVVGGNYLLNQRVAKLSPVNKIDHGFVYLLFRQDKMLIMLKNLSSGTAQQNLSPIKTAEIDIIIPDHIVMEKFGKIVNPIIKMMLDNLNQNVFLSQIRDSLLPRLMSGKIRIEVKR